MLQETDQESRTWAMFCHLAAFAGFIGIGFGHVVGPLVVWLIKKDGMPFVDEQGKESLNFQLTITILSAVAGILCFVLIGIPLLIGLWIADVVFIVLAALAANRGEHYRYPFAIRIIT